MFPIAGYIGRLGAVAVQGSPGRGRDPQGGLAGCGHPDHRHCPPWVAALHLAGGAQTAGAVRATRLRQDNDAVQRIESPARFGGKLFAKSEMEMQYCIACIYINWSDCLITAVTSVDEGIRVWTVFNCWLFCLTWLVSNLQRNTLFSF